MNIRVVVPCHPIVKHYLNQEFGNPVKLNMRHPICKTLNIMLESKKNYRFRYSLPQADHSDQFVLIISDRMRQQVGHHLSPTRVREINTIVKAYFYDKMFDHLEIELYKDPQFIIKQGVIDYMVIKKIPFDAIQVESILKSFRRHRKKTDTSFIKTSWSRSVPKNPHNLSFN